MSSQNIYANTVAEYQARRLFGKEKLRRIAGAEFGNAIKILIGYGYLGDYDNADSQDIDSFIASQIRRLTEFIEENSASSALTKILLSSFICSDVKALYKSSFADGGVSSALYFNDSVTLDAEHIKEAVSELSENPSGKEIDYAIMQAMFAENLAFAKETGTSLLRYCRRQIDITNILSAYRAKKLGYSHEETLSELFDGGEISLENIISSDDVKETEYEEAVIALESNDIRKFRKLTESLLLDTFKKDFTNYSGYGPFIRYVLTQLEEYKTVRYILVCIKNNIAFSVDDFRSIDDD